MVGGDQGQGHLAGSTHTAKPAPSAAVAYVWQHRDRHVIFAHVICIGLALLAYHLYMGIDRRQGEGTLWAAIWRCATDGPTPSREALPGEKRPGSRGGEAGGGPLRLELSELRSVDTVGLDAPCAAGASLVGAAP